MQSFKDKAVVITGGTSGIGLSLAKALASEGAQVLIAGMDQQKAEERASELQNNGLQVFGVRCDVSNPEEVESLADTAFTKFGQVHVLINNAGVGQVGPLHEVSEGDWNWIMDVNLKGVFLVSKVFIKRMLEQDDDALIVNTGSETCFGLPGTALGSMFPYVSSKHGLLGLTDMMMRDYSDQGIRVCLLCPGPVATDIWDAGRSRQDHYGGEKKADPKLGETFLALGMNPDDVAQMTLDGIRRGDEIIITHTHIRDMIDQRYARLSAAMDNTDAWWTAREAQENR